MTARIDITPATPADAAAIATVMRTSFEATYPSFEKRHSPEGDRRFVQDRLMTTTTVETAKDGTTLVGFIAYTPDEIDQLYILPKWHRAQIGTRLLARAKETATRLTLWTFAVNTGARAFYAKNGFREIAETADDNEQGEPDVQLEWTRT